MGTKDKPPSVRTTVSLAKVIWDIAVENMASRGFNDNFSACVADLIRQDQVREAEKRLLQQESSSSRYPSHQVQLNDQVREAPAAAAPPAKKKRAA